MYYDTTNTVYLGSIQGIVLFFQFIEVRLLLLIRIVAQMIVDLPQAVFSRHCTSVENGCIVD